MPISLAQLKANLRTINVQYFSDNVSITYRPSSMTPQSTSEIQDKIDSGEAKNVLIEMLCNTMVAWDVVEENGEMLPITRETLGKTPGPLLLAIAEAMGEDARPKSKSAGRSLAR